MNMCRNTVRNASMIVLAAGFATSALAQNNTRDERNQDRRQMTSQPEQRQDQSKQVASLSMHRASDLIGMDIKNSSDDSLGNLNDLIVDRGSGKISHVVVKSGAILGLGGERVAIPYEVFSYDPIDREFSLGMTSDELDNVSEVTPNDWIVLNSGDLESQLRSIGKSTRMHAQDKYSNMFGKDANRETIEGRVTGVNRWNDNDGSEYISVEIQPTGSEGETKTVILGPSWYVMGSEHAPMESHSATINAVSLDGKDGKYVATGYGADGKEFKIRNSDGTPSWDNPEAGGSSILLSDLLGRDANARTDKGGEIQDALVEANSGMIPVLLFDPNENVLGLGDELHCVPWSETYVWEDVVSIDADLDTLAACQTSPEDVDQLTTTDSIEHIYRPFGAEVTKFNNREHRQWYRDLRNDQQEKSRDHTRDSKRGG